MFGDDLRLTGWNSCPAFCLLIDSFVVRFQHDDFSSGMVIGAPAGAHHPWQRRVTLLLKFIISIFTLRASQLCEIVFLNWWRRSESNEYQICIQPIVSSLYSAILYTGAVQSAVESNASLFCSFESSESVEKWMHYAHQHSIFIHFSCTLKKKRVGLQPIWTFASSEKKGGWPSEKSLNLNRLVRKGWTGRGIWLRRQKGYRF